MDLVTKETIIYKCHPEVHRQISSMIILRRLKYSPQAGVITTRFEKLKIGTKIPTSIIKVSSYDLITR